jgi:hypothetical protein
MWMTSLVNASLAIFMALSVQSHAACERSARDDPAGANAPAPPAFQYIPPNRGAPARRVGGGTRSISQLSVLAPDHVGRTTQSRPRLYWYINPGFRNGVRFRLAPVGATPPLLEILLPPQPNGGIQYLDLEQYNVSLEPGTHYEWGVMLEPFAHQRLPPLLSRGLLMVDDSAPALGLAPTLERPYLAAQQGYWYDAVDWISRRIEAEPPGTALRLQRASLIEQGGLHSAALYEREMTQTGR